MQKILDERDLSTPLREISVLDRETGNFMLPRPVHASAFLMRTR